MKRKHPKKKKTIIMVSVILVCLLGGGTGLFIALKHRDRTPVVKAAEVTTGDFTRIVSANGEITAKNSLSYYSTVTALVESLSVEVGDRVREGDTILLLDRESLENNLIGAENTLANVRMTVQGELLGLRTSYASSVTTRDQAARDLKRAEELHGIGSVSDEELRQKREALALAEASLDSARQKLNFREGRPLDDPRTGSFLPDSEIVDRSPEVRRAEIERDNIRKTLDDYRITAGMSGIVTDLPLEEGRVVTPGALLARIQDTGALTVKANIDEVDLSYVSLGQPVTIKSDSFLDRELRGTVSEIAPTIVKAGDSRVCAIEVSILENPGGIARIGAGASIFITVDERNGVPAIPVESYFIEGGKKWVFVLERASEAEPAGRAETTGAAEADETVQADASASSGKAARKKGELRTAVKREIETGILGIETIEVISGLEPGEEILAAREPSITDGMSVRLIPDPEPAKDAPGGESGSGAASGNDEAEGTGGT